ncbi:MAG: SufD family Fe-S cluster assembly protein [Alphaproteobacteria bacterium]|nr:MAG: SufD family Fe-S cluster assembly protein [Alphaproteobacteria bacterium]
MGALAEKKQGDLAARLAAMDAPARGGAWLEAARAEARARLMAMGLPAARDEYWRFTRPASLNAPTPEPAAPFDDGGEAPMFGEVERLRIVFTDGVFDAAASDPLELAGVEIETLEEAGSRDIHWARDLYGVLETRGHSPVERPFAALNTAFAGAGVVIRVTGRAARPVNLIYRHESDTSDAILHHLVKLEPGADLTLLENGPGAARLSKVLEVDLGAGARFHHVRTQGRDPERTAVTHVFARLAEGATFKSFTLTVNGRLTRNESFVELAGAGAVAHLAGAALGDGAELPFHHDDTVFVTHSAPECESRQVFKKVLRNGAVGVFQGKILVREGAQKTDGYQKSQALMLDDDSTFLAKPELEIYADDVACSHGSTSGAIDEEALFYLRSRGVPERQAANLLVLAFLADAIDEIEDAAIADDIRTRLEGWVKRHRG